MPKKTRKKTTTVREHPLHVPISEKNPTGITIRDRHLRRLKGTYLDTAEIESVFQNYDRKGIVYPTKNKLKEYKDADRYDNAIAIWTDYFNKKFNADPPLDPDVVKALIASESEFRVNPPDSKKAFGIIQITPSTLKIMQDPEGEAKELILEYKGLLKSESDYRKAGLKKYRRAYADLKK